MTSKYKYLLFDADDTILDFRKSELIATKIIFERYGLKATKARINRYVRINDKFWQKHAKGLIEKDKMLEERFRVFFKRYHLNLDYKKVNTEYLDTLADHVFIIDGIKEILDYLHGKYKLYIITNGIKKVQDKRFLNSGILDYFEKIYISEEISFHKPEKGFFEYVINDINDKDLNKYLVIGDNAFTDIMGGVAMGIDTIWYNPNKKKTKVPYNYEVKDVNEYRIIL